MRRLGFGIETAELRITCVLIVLTSNAFHAGLFQSNDQSTNPINKFDIEIMYFDSKLLQILENRTNF